MKFHNGYSISAATGFQGFGYSITVGFLAYGLSDGTKRLLK